MAWISWKSIEASAGWKTRHAGVGSRAPTRVSRAQQEIDESFNHYQTLHRNSVEVDNGSRQHPVAASLFPLYNPAATIFINVTDFVHARRYFTEQKTRLHAHTRTYVCVLYYYARSREQQRCYNGREIGQVLRCRYASDDRAINENLGRKA